MSDSSLPPVSRESAARSYLHLAAYVVPALFFVTFASLVLIPRMEKIWAMAGPDAVKARWILDLCSAFVGNFPAFLGVGTALLVILEKSWPGWDRLRSRVIRIFTWCVNFAVLLGMTWMAVTALLITPMAIVQANGPILDRPPNP